MHHVAHFEGPQESPSTRPCIRYTGTAQGLLVKPGMGAVAQQDHDITAIEPTHGCLVDDGPSEQFTDFRGDEVAFFAVARIFIRQARLLQRITPRPVRSGFCAILPANYWQQFGPAPQLLKMSVMRLKILQQKIIGRVGEAVVTMKDEVHKMDNGGRGSP